MTGTTGLTFTNCRSYRTAFPPAAEPGLPNQHHARTSPAGSGPDRYAQVLEVHPLVVAGQSKCEPWCGQWVEQTGDRTVQGPEVVTSAPLDGGCEPTGRCGLQ